MTLPSSITPTELRKVVFRVNYVHDWTNFLREMEGWALIGEELCRLVDWLRETGYSHTLEVELRLTKIGGDPGKIDFTIFCPGLG